MESEQLSCPYCNAMIPLPDPASAGPRVRCPRCQEVFANRKAVASLERNGALVGLDPLRTAAARPVESPWRTSNRSVAGLLLTIMAAMAGVALAFALWTQQERRKRDYPQTSATSQPAPIVAVPPAKLSALGYLPAGTNVLAAMHVAEAMQKPSERDFLLNLRLGSANVSIDNVEKWSGLKLEEMDHLVLGARVDDRLLPPVFLVIQTKQPYDPDRIRETLRAKRTEKGKRVLYRFSVEKSPLEPALWFAGDRTLVLSLTAANFEELPLVPQAGIEQFPPAVQVLLTERLPTGTPLWIAGHANDWSKTIAHLPLETMLKERRRSWEGVQTFGIWLEFRSELTLRAAFGCMDDAAAEAFDGYLAHVLQGGKEKVAGRDQSTGLLDDLTRTFVRSRKGSWIDVQAAVAPNEVLRALAAGQ